MVSSLNIWIDEMNIEEGAWNTKQYSYDIQMRWQLIFTFSLLNSICYQLSILFRCLFHAFSLGVLHIYASLSSNAFIVIQTSPNDIVFYRTTNSFDFTFIQVLLENSGARAHTFQFLLSLPAFIHSFVHSSLQFSLYCVYTAITFSVCAFFNMCNNRKRFELPAMHTAALNLDSGSGRSFNFFICNDVQHQ